MPEWFDPSARHGRDEVRSFVGGILDDWEVWEMNIRELRENGDRILVESRLRSIGPRSGIELKGRVFQVFTIRAGKIVRLQDFIEPEQAFRAAGLAT